MLAACVIFAILVVIPTGNTLLPRKFDVINFGHDNINDLLDDVVIPKPSPLDTKRKGKTALGDDCFCVITSTYLPPVQNEKCICKKKECCEERGNKYLPPDDCEICPKCYCDTKTFTLINEESGHCPPCRPPPCRCVNGHYVNELSGNCPVPCNPPPCRCVNGRYINELSGNCPVPCNPPPCLCINGRYINQLSGNCPVPCVAPCVCRNSQLFNKESGNCPVCEPPPCTCVNGKYINQKSGNCPVPCDPPPCVCRNGHLINKESGNCPPCTPNCSCYKGQLINKETGVCPTDCPYYYGKPEGYENLPADFL